MISCFLYQDQVSLYQQLCVFEISGGNWNHSVQKVDSHISHFESFIFHFSPQKILHIPTQQVLTTTENRCTAYTVDNVVSIIAPFLCHQCPKPPWQKTPQTVYAGLWHSSCCAMLVNNHIKHEKKVNKWHDFIVQVERRSIIQWVTVVY